MDKRNDGAEVVGQVCTICGQPAGPQNSAQCDNCNEIFHLKLRQDDDGPECGRVWVNDQFATLEYGCLRCLDELPAAEPLPRQPAESRWRRYRRVR
ncbi:MAG: hypothetical protein WEB00_00470 [Dehalococcoidia bacterium]